LKLSARVLILSFLRKFGGRSGRYRNKHIENSRYASIKKKKKQKHSNVRVCITFARGNNNNIIVIVIRRVSYNSSRRLPPSNPGVHVSIALLCVTFANRTLYGGSGCEKTVNRLTEVVRPSLLDAVHT